MTAPIGEASGEALREALREAFGWAVGRALVRALVRCDDAAGWMAAGCGSIRNVARRSVRQSMRRLSRSMAGIALWSGLAAGIAAAETIRIGAETTFAPFVMLDASGQLTGFDRAFGDAMCERAGLTCEWVVTGFDELIPGVVSGRFDLAMSGLGNSPERRAQVDFTTVYLPSSVPSAFAGPVGAPPPEAARIGVQSGTIHEAHLAGRGLRHVPFDSAAAALDALVQGKVDLVFGSSSYLAQVLPRDYPMVTILSFDPVAVEGSAIAIAKGRDDLRNRLDATIQAMLADGTVAQLARVWFTARTNM